MADQANLHPNASFLPKVLQPISDMLEARSPRYVEDNQGTIGFAVVAAYSERYFIVMAR